MAIFWTWEISQGSITRSRCGGIFNNDFITNLVMNPSVKEFWKLINVWRSYRKKSSVLGFFDSRCSMCMTALLVKALCLMFNVSRTKTNFAVLELYDNGSVTFPLSFKLNCIFLLLICIFLYFLYKISFCVWVGVCEDNFQRLLNSANHPSSTLEFVTRNSFSSTALF